MDDLSKLDETTTTSSMLSSRQVALWLDANPDFLHDYLRNLKMKRRCSTAILLSEKMTSDSGQSESSQLLLSDLHSNLRINADPSGSSINLASTVATNTTNGAKPATSTSSRNKSGSEPSKRAFRSTLKTFSNTIKTSSIKYISSYTSLLSVPVSLFSSNSASSGNESAAASATVNTTSLNVSMSEPTVSLTNGRISFFLFFF
jgi:hypothetical protein